MASSQPQPTAAEPKLPKAVVGLGLVSLLTDTSSEAIFPLLPAFLATLGASNAFIGLSTVCTAELAASPSLAARRSWPTELSRVGAERFIVSSLRLVATARRRRAAPVHGGG